MSRPICDDVGDAGGDYKATSPPLKGRKFSQECPRPLVPRRPHFRMNLASVFCESLHGVLRPHVVVCLVALLRFSCLLEDRSASELVLLVKSCHNQVEKD